MWPIGVHVRVFFFFFTMEKDYKNVSRLIVWSWEVDHEIGMNMPLIMLGIIIVALTPIGLG